ncbi:hypothetical protein N431DRAFT_565013 [Stipitochalara longipes BDJ]|nr:hypothetical protein N431DRAFT_565013 [Stipitochalara longipes BDJ]
MSPSDMPSEMVTLIASHLIAASETAPAGQLQTPDKVAIYATVSKDWQKCIEKHTFSSILLTPARLDEFDQIIRGPRRKYVRLIALDVVLDSYDDEACCRYETEEGQQKNNRLFTQTLRRLFLTMSSWEGVQEADLGIYMSVKVYSPSDHSRLGQKEGRARRALRHRTGAAKDIFDRRFDKSYLRLVNTENDGEASALPHSVSAITGIEITAGYLRHMYPASCSLILSQLPRLRTFRAYLWDDERKDLDLRKRARHEFASSINLWPASINEVDLHYYNSAPADETFMPPNLLPSSSNEDPLSSELRAFSQQLTDLRLSDMTIGPEFFWPSAASQTSDSLLPHWPHLTSLAISCTPITPSGQWLFERDPDEELEEFEWGEDPRLYMEEDELPAPQDERGNHFRKIASPELMNAFYVAAGKAAGKMPVLRQMWLDATTGTKIGHSFQYTATATSASVCWRSTPLFEPSEEVLNVWKEAARKKLEVDLEISCVEGY